MANSTAKSTPRDAQVMAAILKDSGVVEYEPRLINHMLEFTNQYVADILEDAKVLSQHAGKKNIDADDVKLAVQFKTDNSFVNPPPKDLLQEIARQKNSQPLPAIKPYSGPRSLPDRYCLTNPNFKLRSAKKPQAQSRIQFGLPAQQRIALSAQSKGIAVKNAGQSMVVPIASPSVKSLGGTVGQSVTVVPKVSPAGSGGIVAAAAGGSTPGQVTIITKPTPNPAAKPTIRINTGPASAAGIGASGLAQMVTSQTPTGSTPTPTTSLLPPSIASSSASLVANTFNPLRRKADDDDYDA